MAGLGTSEQLRGARAMLRLEQSGLSEASRVSLATVKRLEGIAGPLRANPSTIAALQRALEAMGIEFIEENGGGAGLRLKKGRGAGAIEPGELNASNDE